MVYLGLLRGVNVGGKNRVEMKILKKIFEDVGMENVSTYINSGNIIFTNSTHNQKDLTLLLEEVIKNKFQLDVKILIFNKDQIDHIVKSIPKEWLNVENRCNLMFLWEEFDKPEVLSLLNPKEGIDQVKYIPGAVIFATNKKLITKSGLLKIFGTELYKNMTIRNSNTSLKLFELMKNLS